MVADVAVPDGQEVTETVEERAYLSIGEVLALLKEEFPDVTISKIRFLESQGLLDPERTPSGYRKFYDADVERLRWILRQQREHFLPLKVIKGRLESAQASSRSTTEPGPSGPRAEADPLPSTVQGSNPLDLGVSGASLTLEELAVASGLTTEAVAELERYGLLAPRVVAGSPYYDEDALLVARTAAGFMKYGVEARHLRTYRNTAEREAAFFEQLIMPMIRQRNPTARRQAIETLGELARLGADLRAALLRHALRAYGDGG